MIEALEGFEKVRIDTGDDPEAAERFGVRGIPQLVVLSPAGEEIARQRGYAPPDEVLAFLTGARATLAALAEEPAEAP